MSTLHNQEFVLAKRPKDDKDLKDIWTLKECEMPRITNNGEFICETLYITVDPYLSSQIKKSALGGAINAIGTVQYNLSVVKVIESRNDDYPVGTIFVALLPWARYSLQRGDARFTKIIKKPGEKDNFFDRLGYDSALGSLGMPTQTAYYGALDVGKFNERDVLVVSGCAGAVGSILGQIAKHVLKCKKVIGIAGGKEKCEYAVKELGFDAAIDYKEYNTREKMAKRLQEVAGEPITAYFDNTGGFTTDAIFDIIARFGRIIICGQISTYNKSEDVESEAYCYPNYLAKTIYKALSITGYLVGDYASRNDKEFFVDMPKWIESGVIKTKEMKVEGFEKTPQAYEMLYSGANFGKIVIKVVGKQSF